MIMKKQKQSTTQLLCCNQSDGDEFPILQRELSSIRFDK